MARQKTKPGGTAKPPKPRAKDPPLQIPKESSGNPGGFASLRRLPSCRWILAVAQSRRHSMRRTGVNPGCQRQSRSTTLLICTLLLPFVAVWAQFVQSQIGATVTSIVLFHLSSAGKWCTTGLNGACSAWTDTEAACHAVAANAGLSAAQKAMVFGYGSCVNKVSN